MKRILTVFTLLLALPTALLAGQRIQLSDSPEDFKIALEQATQSRTEIRFDLSAFTQQEVDIDGETFYDIRIPGEGILTIKGEPALPEICRSIIIPDDAQMKINVLKSEYQEFRSTPVAPSKGNIKRTLNPDDIPYEFGEIYNADKWYPSRLADIREPYILRDLRGTVIEIHPFQYNPKTQTLRVYTSITVEVVAVGTGLINVFDRPHPFDRIDPSFELIYKRHFINYNQGALLYTPVPEAGEMLIITYDSFSDEMLPLVDWKKQKGIKTTIVNVSTIGNNSTAIDNFIQAFYESTNLAWVLLVGDAAQVATPYASGGSSDPSYAKVAGGDNYPDIFIGRFSAENANQVITQVERTINYEKFPQAGAAWYHMATGVASDLGPGHYGEYDYQHMDNIRADLLAYNYTLVDQIYDPEANQTMVANALNAGRSFANYTGHGSTTGWGSSGFSNSDVNNLVNDYKMPFIFSVACVNGDFDGTTCFAEAWLRATNDGNGHPTGAMGAYMSSINQDWDPPMYAQDEATDLLVAESKLTFGGICYNAACYMIDVSGSVGVEHYDTWHIFGDPSVMLTTDTPTALTVTHDASIIFTATNYNVLVSGVAGALCALYYNGTLYGSAYTGAGGGATIEITEPLPIGETLTLTVTAYNRLPYFGSVTAISPAGPYVVYDQYAVDDYQGNGNGLVDFGERIVLDMQLKNVGPDNALNVSAVLSCSDSYVTITDANENFGTIPGNNGTVNIYGAYAFAVASNTPDEHNILFHLEITGGDRDTWTGDFVIQTHAPVLEFAGVAVNDQSGNGNGILEANETAAIIVTLANNGSGAAYSVLGNLSESDSYVTVTDPAGAFGNLMPGGSGNNLGNVFTAIAASDFPQGHAVTFNLQATASGGYTSNMQFILRTAESFEYSNGGYTGEGNWQWGAPTAGPPGAYFGTKVWGTILNGDYENNRDDDLISPPMHIHSAEAILEFYHWYDMEDYYDGGNVQISTDGGINWDLLTPQGGYPHSGIYSLGEPGYTNTSSGWVQARISLSAYAGHDVRFKWRFGSDSYVTAAGWYIDDVTILNNIPQPPPNMSFNPSTYTVSAGIDEIVTRSLNLINDGDGPLYYQLATQTDSRSNIESGAVLSLKPSADRPKPLGFHEKSDKANAKPEPWYSPMILDQGGPDAFGYSWIDSNEPSGPDFYWVDITSVGTQITGLEDDDNVGAFPIGFNFDFYDATYSTFRFCTNGFISFTSTVTAYSNSEIPVGGEPYSLIVPLWDDLDFTSGGNAYYYTNNDDSLVISWINVPHYSSGSPPGPYTFQVILLSSGKIVFQYQNVNSPANSASIGIQNSNGTIGLEIVYNAEYMENNLAIAINKQGDWLSVEPASGTIPAHQSAQATVTFDASGMEAGTYTGAIFLTSNDPVNPDTMIPATFIVGGQGIPNLQLSLGSLTDSLIENQQVTHDIIISNSGDASLLVNFSSGYAWLRFSGGPFNVPSSGNATLHVTIDATGLTCGNHAGSLEYSCNDPDTPSGAIPVALHVYYPNISVDQEQIEESLVEGARLITYIEMANSANGILHYTVEHEEAGITTAKIEDATNSKADNPVLEILLADRDVWLSVSPSEGSIDGGEADSLEVTLDAATLDAGQYNGTITINSNDPDQPIVSIPVILTVTSGAICEYVPGDVNSDDNVIGSDVTFAINFFRGVGASPQDSCYSNLNETWLYVAGDANGDCRFIGSDITFLVSYFRGINPAILFCPDLPPSMPPPTRIGREKGNLAK